MLEVGDVGTLDYYAKEEGFGDQQPKGSLSLKEPNYVGSQHKQRQYVIKIRPMDVPHAERRDLIVDCETEEAQKDWMDAIKTAAAGMGRHFDESSNKCVYFNPSNKVTGWSIEDVCQRSSTQSVLKPVSRVSKVSKVRRNQAQHGQPPSSDPPKTGTAANQGSVSLTLARNKTRMSRASFVAAGRGSLVPGGTTRGRSGTVALLKDQLDAIGVDYQDCIEKGDLEKRLEASQLTMTSPQNRKEAVDPAASAAVESVISASEPIKQRPAPTVPKRTSSSDHRLGYGNISDGPLDTIDTSSIDTSSILAVRLMIRQRHECPVLLERSITMLERSYPWS